MIDDWPAKDPQTIADYTWQPTLDVGDTISGFTATVTSGTATIDSTSFSDSAATLWLSGGAAGEKTLITLTIETAGGRTFDEEGSIAIASNQSSAPVIADGTYYGNIAEYRAYQTARGRDINAQTDVGVTTALLVASEWLDGSFRNRWPGYRVHDRATQTRDWPRAWVVDIDGYPVAADVPPIEVEQATYEAAYRYLTDNTSLLIDYTPNKYKRVAIDGAVTVDYRSLAADTIQKQFPVIGHILDRLVGGGAVSSLSSRAVRA